MNDADLLAASECDWPPEVRALPVVTASRVDTTRLSSFEIDQAVREAVGDGRPLYAIDRELLQALEPDLILTQNLCAVCAVSADSVDELCATDAEVVALDAHTLAEIEERIVSLAELLGVPARGGAVVAEMEAKLAAVRAEASAVDRNRTLIEKATMKAAGMGATWVVSGELVVSGYRFHPLIGTDWIATQPDAWMRPFAELTASLGVVSFVSHPERDSGSGKFFNTLFVIGREGTVLARHQKLHPTPGSEDWSSPGRLSDPVQVDGIYVGLLICADAYPPEPALRLRELGAELLISAAAWWPGDYGPKGEWEARSLETRLPSGGRIVDCAVVDTAYL